MSKQFDDKDEHSTGNLPVIYVPRAAPHQADRYAMPASFASQLMASRDRMALRGGTNVLPANMASNAYVKGGKIAVKRMPNGYVRTLVV